MIFLILKSEMKFQGQAPWDRPYMIYFQFYITFFQLLQHHELFHAGLNRREYCCTMQSSMTRTKDSIKDCKFFFKDLQVLSAHYLDKHQVDFTNPFVCNECDMDFIFEEALFNHQKIQHSIELR